MPRYPEFPTALYEYLLHQVPPTALQEFLTMHYADVVPRLPGPAAVAVSQYVFDAVRALQQSGYVDDALFVKFAEWRPRDPYVRTVAVTVLGHDPLLRGGDAPTRGPGDSGDRPRPVLLVLMACPEDQSQLDLAKEVGLITDTLTPVRDHVQVVYGWEVGADDVLDLIADHKPTWIHFGGHGGRDGTLLVVGPAGSTHRLRYDALARFIGVMRSPPKCIVLNNCFSGAATSPLTQYVDAVIGMRKEVTDEAALSFSRGLYRRLADGLDLEEAFLYARARLGSLEPPADELPQLNPRAGADPRELRMAPARPTR
ncbi:hypothetical protein [Nannocystis punicea]|uniref:CHAT domain-containing protein n=1 Tax=Nannocystis punicea TaxID=2995304 RepID=A0ABY7GZW2_9BACT|nr:hypothetical protein [Nannocystis poenicansa]WAS92374.1 hypothetical protein O0S08_39855 [Nannocystis poenicansa]